MPAVSVIIPNYNHAQFLVQRIESVLTQEFDDFEVIILDDKSRDNSCDIIEQYRAHPKVSHVVLNNENSGSTFKQWFKGIQLALGKYIWVAESDDVAKPDFLASRVKELEKDESIAISYCQSMLIDEQGSELGTWQPPFIFEGLTRWETDFLASGNEEIANYLCLENTIPNASAVLFRRDALNDQSRLSLEFKLNGDRIFWISLLKNRKIAYQSIPQNLFRTHSGSVRKTIRTFSQLSEQLRLIKLIIAGAEISEENLQKMYQLLIRQWHMHIDFRNGRDLLKPIYKQYIRQVKELDDTTSLNLRKVYRKRLQKVFLERLKF